ncbi:hypothetical protein H5P28_04580 [Ruficoccus amylovorans]|uniref:DUF4365 domain-containing protein n=1 Tax=Ruficoccus amylovorans TaxID=1804625 RepID=A0A842HAT6_9BACT|nr:hypothetical protein [Ruficoccus amylovorans]MBC2593532.1 hypothetical protein [Ruficoccus amylovorans]
MCKPAGYPQTDGAEQDAVTMLLSSLNADKVKADIRTRDKYPNVDGTLEIVDSERKPEGKFDVQIRKASAGCSSYNCPISLYAYSKVSSLPLLLIAVDTANKKVMWRHIFGGMPEYRDGQQSFTVKFTADDEIGRSEAYLNRWRLIVRDYNDRIQKYPKLAARVSRDIDLDNINDLDVQYFNKYANELNSLLERDFQSIRSRVLPPAARYGIGIANTTANKVEYQHHRIAFGARQPTVFRIESASSDSIFDDPSAVAFNWAQRSSLKNPREEALKFLRLPIEKSLKNYQLVVHGQDAACNILAQFVECFPHVFGINPTGEYSLKELQDAYYQTLPEACARYLPLPEGSENDHVGQIFLWQMEESLKKTRYLRLTHIPPLSSYSIDSGGLPVQAYEDSLKYLLAAGVEKVVNPWETLGPRDGDWIWSFADKAKMMSNLRKLFQRLIANYSEFVRGNEFFLSQSAYLDNCTSIIFNIVSSKGSGVNDCPMIEEYHIPNSTFEYPKVTTLIDGGSGRLDHHPSKWRELTLDGRKHSPSYFSQSSADWPFRRCPYLHGLYRLLASDLNAQYGYSFHID